MLDIDNMAQPVKDFGFTFVVAYPNGRQFRKRAKVIGIVSDARWLRDQLLHTRPLGTKIIDPAMVDEAGKVMPEQHQPELFASAWPENHTDDQLNKLASLGRLTHPGPGTPRGFSFTEESGEELPPVKGSQADIALANGERLVGLGYKAEEPDKYTRKLWTPKPASKAGQSVIEETKKMADEGTEPGEVGDLPTTAEMQEKRAAAHAARKTTK